MSQAREALKKANEHRMAAFRERDRLRAMPSDEAREALAVLIETCTDTAVLSGRLSDYLMTPHRVGIQTARRVIRDCGIRRADVRLRDLTDRQRSVVAQAIRDGYRVKPMARAA